MDRPGERGFRMSVINGTNYSRIVDPAVFTIFLVIAFFTGFVVLFHRLNKARFLLSAAAFFCMIMAQTAAVHPAGAQQIPPELFYSPTPTATLSLMPEPAETSVPEQSYIEKIFVPTNTPVPVGKSMFFPDSEYCSEFCTDSDIECLKRFYCDSSIVSEIEIEDPSSTAKTVDIHYDKINSFKLNIGDIWNETLSGENNYGLHISPGNPSIDINFSYDSSVGRAGIGFTDNGSQLSNAAAIKVNYQNPFSLRVGDASAMVTGSSSSQTPLYVKTVDLEQSAKEAAVRVFGNASLSVTEGSRPVTADAIDLYAPGGTISANVGAVQADVSGTGAVDAAAVDLSAGQRSGDPGKIAFTQGRLWYYHFFQYQDEKDPSSQIENKNQCIQFFPTDLTDINGEETALHGKGIDLTANGSIVNAYGAHLKTDAGTDSSIDFGMTNNSRISVDASGQSGTAYGLYVDSGGGTLNTVIEGSVIETDNFTNAEIGDTAGIAIKTNGTGNGSVNIQTGLAPISENPVPPAVTVSGTQVGICNDSSASTTKYLVIYGTVSGDKAPILTEEGKNTDNFTLAAWAVEAANGHTAFIKDQNGDLSADTSFEKNIRYILLADPSELSLSWDEGKSQMIITTDDGTSVSVEGADSGDDVALDVEATDPASVEEVVRKLCEKLESRTALTDDMFVQDLKTESEKYLWAKQDTLLTLKSNQEGYSITQAYWREGTDEDAKMTCNEGSCSFTVPMGGGIWIHDIKMAEDAKVTVTGNPDEVFYGDTFDLTASVTPEQTGDWTWGASDQTVAEVISSGNNRAAVNIKGTGKVTITAEFASGGNSGKGSLELIVKPKPITITADNKSKVYDNDPGTDPALTAKIDPEPVKGDKIEYTLSRDPGQDAGEYAIYVTFDKEAYPNYEITVTNAENTNEDYTGKAGDASGIFTITKKPITITADNKNKAYDNDPDTDPALTAAVKGVPANGSAPVYLLSRDQGQDVGDYKITVTAEEAENPNYTITAVNGTFSITEKPAPEVNSIEFFRIFGQMQMPATGFSSVHKTVLTEQPKDLNYKPLRLFLQIPTLDVKTDLVTVPAANGSWQVEWLHDRTGVLEGSPLPGEGYSVLAAHNTLNDTEYGPFALLSTMEINDLITVNEEDGSMKLFRVYANELLDPDDMAKLAAIAEQEENSLVLITCENEAAEGGYLNRRVVFARPL